MILAKSISFFLRKKSFFAKRISKFCGNKYCLAQRKSFWRKDIPFCEKISMSYLKLSGCLLFRVIVDSIFNSGIKLKIQSLSHQLVVNIGKYLPKRGKVNENNECRKAQVIFENLSPLRKYFPILLHKTYASAPL